MLTRSYICQCLEMIFSIVYTTEAMNNKLVT